jgi:hypothetical protein
MRMISKFVATAVGLAGNAVGSIPDIAMLGLRTPTQPVRLDMSRRGAVATGILVAAAFRSPGGVGPI